MITDELMNESLMAAHIAMKIDGQIREEEAAFLYRLSRRIGNIVEIGCLFGRSTSAIAQGAEVFGADVTSIDPFIKTPNTNKMSSQSVWEKNLKKHGLKLPELLAMKSHDAAALYDKDKEISFLFIDGGHSYETVKEDIDDWVPRVKVTGVVAFHDMFMPHIDGVTRAVSEWWLDVYDGKNPAWKFEGMFGYMIAFRRYL
jgi:predicted O-methyltransferase YrrM